MSELLTPDRIAALLRAAVILLLGVIAARIISGWFGQALARKGKPQEAILARRIVFYASLAIVGAMVMHELGFHLGVLFGAAGVLTVAIGFASQTSASNLVSGIFLIAERSFVAGDTIQIGDHTGEILSIDLLSVKLRTLDNVLVRVPNEEIIKSRVKNLTHFPIRRTDIVLHVALDADLAGARRALNAVAARNPQCLVDPGPEFNVVKFTDNGIELMLSMWARREGFAGFQTRVREDLRDAFLKEGIPTAIPMMVVRTDNEASRTPAPSTA
jgi:small-conductance mechanosensitive channel